MGFVIDTKFWHYPDREFTLFQKACHIVKVACHCSVFTVAMNLFYKTEIRQVFDCRINGLSINSAFFRNHSAWGKARTVFVVAVPNQTTVNRKIPRLQSQIKYSIRNHKKVFVFHVFLLSIKFYKLRIRNDKTKIGHWNLHILLHRLLLLSEFTV